MTLVDVLIITCVAAVLYLGLAWVLWYFSTEYRDRRKLKRQAQDIK